MKVAILAVGNEVLCGKTLNTNSMFIAREVEGMGGKVTHQQVVPDQIEEIVRGLEIAYTYADLVITIGGLGPTVDDLTRDGVAKYFEVELVYDEDIYREFVTILKEVIKIFLRIMSVKHINLRVDWYFLIITEQPQLYFCKKIFKLSFYFQVHHQN